MGGRGIGTPGPNWPRITSISRDVIRHALEVTGADVSVLLQPTSPIRDDDLIDRAIRAYRSEQYDSMATGFMYPLYPPHGVEHRRQDIREVFVNDGSVVISSRASIMADSLFGEKKGTMVTDREQNVDIDEAFDFWLAEQVLIKRMKSAAGDICDQCALLTPGIGAAAAKAASS